MHAQNCLHFIESLTLAVSTARFSGGSLHKLGSYVENRTICRTSFAFRIRIAGKQAGIRSTRRICGGADKTNQFSFLLVLATTSKTLSLALPFSTRNKKKCKKRTKIDPKIVRAFNPQNCPFNPALKINFKVEQFLSLEKILFFFIFICNSRRIELNKDLQKCLSFNWAKASKADETAHFFHFAALSFQIQESLSQFCGPLISITSESLDLNQLGCAGLKDLQASILGRGYQSRKL